MPAAAIACALALSPGSGTAAQLNGNNDLAVPTWLQFRAAFAAEELWPDAAGKQIGSASQRRSASVLHNTNAPAKPKVNAGGRAMDMAASETLPGKARQTLVTVN